MQFSNMITCIDVHTAGEPIRIVTAGFPSIRGSSMLERRRYVMDHLDAYRKLLMQEPRGHDAMYGAILTPPATEDGDIGVLFIDNGGMGTMCGHGTIGISKAVFDTGMMPAAEGVNMLKIDTPAGRVVSSVVCRGGMVESVSFRNVPSFLFKSGLPVSVEGVGEILVDVCFGGAFYVFADAASLGLDIVPEETGRLVERGMAIRRAASKALAVEHPTEPEINWIYGTILITPPEVGGTTITTRNVCVYGASGVDRSPCGTGTSARIAQLYAKGIMKPGMTLKNHSIIDTVFCGSIAEETTVGEFPAIIPQISGSAYIMGFNQIVLEPQDPMPEGFRVF